MKKTLSLILCLLLLASLFAGCRDEKTVPGTTTAAPPAEPAVTTAAPVTEPLTAADVIQKAAEKMTDVNSMRLKMLLTLSFGISGEELGAMDFNVTGDFDCEVTREPRASHMKGTVNGFGQEQTMENFSFLENGKTVVYNWSPTEEAFVRTVNAQGSGSVADSFSSFESFRDTDWTLEETEDAYVLKGELEMKYLQGSLPMNDNVFGDMTGGVQDLESKVPTTLVIDKQTLQYRSFTADMTETVGSLLSMLGGMGGNASMILEATFSDFNAVGPITPPADYEAEPGATDEPETHEYEDPTARDYSDISAEELAKVHPMLFQVTDSQGASMYLFGTIHVGDGRNRYALDLLSSFVDACEALAVEFDIKAFEADLEAAMDVTMKFMYTDGTGAKDHMPADLYDRACALLAESGLAPNLLNGFNLAMWSQFLEQALVTTRTDLAFEDAMDSALIQYCYNNGIEVRDVESAELQYNLLLSFPDELNILMMEAILEDVDAAAENTERLYEVWLGGDYDEILAAVNEENGDLSGYTQEELALLKLYNEEMLVKRNRGMRDKALEWLKEGDTVFFAVGAAHLVGETGLVTLLREAGCTVEQIDYINP